MPAGDRTGPMGMGPRTGRAAGYCAGYDRPGYMNSYGGGYGWGRGRGRGRGRGGYGWGRGGGWGRGWGCEPGPAMGHPPEPSWAYPPRPAPYTTADELEMLKGEHEHLGRILADIQKRIEDLQAGQQKKKD